MLPSGCLNHAAFIPPLTTAASIARDHSRSDTTMSRATTFASAAAPQLVMRMQPLDSVLPTLPGDGVPWMP